MNAILDKQERVALTKWHIQEKQLDKALIQIKHALEDDTEDSEAILIAARLYAQLQLFSHAQNLFLKYLEKNKDDLNTQFQLGMCYFDGNDNKNALKVWNKLLENNEKHPPALFYSAIALLRDNKVQEASKNLKSILDSAQIDNLYYNKAKELLVQIDSQSTNLSNISADNIYKTEH